jgi:beta-lysine N6-acetyltransferase
MKVPYIFKWEKGPDYIMHVYLDFINERIRVDDYRGNIYSIISEIKAIAKEYSFTKVIIKARSEDWRSFLSSGFELEGIIEGYYNGSDAFFMANYLSDLRRTSPSWKIEDDILEKTSTLPVLLSSELPANYSIRTGKNEDSKNLANLYGSVFKTYPTPMNDESYIKKVISEGTIFKIIELNGQIVSAASAEINKNYNNAEMTDCATLPDHRKHGFMQLLISELEQQLLLCNIYCSYSLAIAKSYGMNACLKKLGYKYTGRLTNNCMMNNRYENMNVWVKKLV